MLIPILIAALATMLISLVGLLFFTHVEFIKKSTDYLISLSIGTFLAVVFIDLIPEALRLSPASGPFYILGGFLLFFLLSHFLFVHYHHHHPQKIHEHNHIGAGGILVLVGDLTHNFVDGIIIATAFMVDLSVGIATTIGVLLHEIPQEMAEFFVLIKAGYSKIKALTLNFLVSTSVLVGALVAYFFLTSVKAAVGPLLGIAAGNLLYIATSDLLPEIKATTARKFFIEFALMLLGALIIIVVI